MAMTVDTTRRDAVLQLGSLKLPVSSYETACNVPAVRKTCIGGEAHTVLLGEIPCTLTVTGTLLRSGIADAAEVLHAALRAHTAFDFLLDEMQFSGMQLTDFKLKCRCPDRTAEFTVTMIGGMMLADPV